MYVCTNKSMASPITAIPQSLLPTYILAMVVEKKLRALHPEQLSLKETETHWPGAFGTSNPSPVTYFLQHHQNYPNKVTTPNREPMQSFSFRLPQQPNRCKSLMSMNNLNQTYAFSHCQAHHKSTKLRSITYMQKTQCSPLQVLYLPFQYL